VGYKGNALVCRGELKPCEGIYMVEVVETNDPQRIFNEKQIINYIYYK
jgi:hypothetical protein